MAALKSSPLNDASVMRPTGIYLPKASSSVASRSARQGRACSLLIGVIAVWTLHFLCTGDITSALLITSGAAQSIHNDQKPASASGNFRWSDVGPSRTLQYTPCFGSYQCARLSVPLNWNASIEEQEASPRAAIAIIKLPAKVPVTDSRYGGPILMNPGGPGESGVYQVAFEGQHLQTVVDSHIDPLEDTTSSAESGKYFDVIGFDPRGVNNTTPRLRCFPDAFNQQAWLLRYLDFGLLWSSESVVGYEWARASALGASCAREEADGGILRYANTAQVAGDMVQIVEKEGEWRAAEAARILEKLDIRDEGLDEIMERTAYRAGQEKLQYWGKSYGTVIGATVSALYPERVKRVILDGVVDPADHYSGGWLTQLLDSDKIVSKFSEYCFEAGPEKCPLYIGFSPSDIESRFTSILLSLKKNPIPVMLPPSSVKNSGPELVTYGDAHLYLLSSMYFTFSTTEMFWDMLIALESRDTTSPTLLDLVAQKQARLSPAECDGGDDVEVPYPCVPYNSMLGPNQVIGCMDTGGSTNMTQDGYKEYLALLEAQSRWISPSWARNKLGCLGYAVQPAWRPDLTFETQKWDNTSHPLLIISNTHDPVTPIRNGRRVSTIFPGSVVLQQDSEGHCSHSNPSFCTARSIREYFQTGELPREGTVCQPEVKPFVGCIKEGGCDFEKVEEQRLWESLVDMADPFGLRRKNVTTKASTHFEAWSHLVSHKGLHT